MLVVQRAINAYLMRCNSSTKMFYCLMPCTRLSPNKDALYAQLLVFFSFFTHLRVSCRKPSYAPTSITGRTAYPGRQRFLPIYIKYNVTVAYNVRSKSSSPCSCALQTWMTLKQIITLTLTGLLSFSVHHNTLYIYCARYLNSYRGSWIWLCRLMRAEL